MTAAPAHCMCEICVASLSGRPPPSLDPALAHLRQPIAKMMRSEMRPVFTRVTKAAPSGPAPMTLEVRAFVKGALSKAPFDEDTRRAVFTELSPLLQALGVEVDASPGADPQTDPRAVVAAMKSAFAPLAAELKGELTGITASLTKAASVRPPPPQPRPPSPSVIWGDDVGRTVALKAAATRKAALKEELRRVPRRFADDLSMQITERSRIKREIDALGASR